LQAVLNYLKKCVVCEEVCGLVSWTLGHKILSLCYKMMRNYDTVEFFYGEQQNDHLSVQSMMQAFGNMYGLRINTNFLHSRMHYAGEYTVCRSTKSLFMLYRLSATELQGRKKTYGMSVNNLYGSNLVLFTACLRHSS
jgi:hypothetical protein